MAGLLLSSQLAGLTFLDAGDSPYSGDWFPDPKYRDHHCCQPSPPQNCPPQNLYPSGPTGPTGATGPAGPAGPTGPQGKKGKRGKTGPRGKEGEQGCQGEQGEPGEPGERGPRGERGKRGCKGDPGPRGVQGPQGLPGENGENGINGLNGPRGPTGATGTSGSAVVGDVAFQATYQGIDASQSVAPGAKVFFNTLGYNQGSQVIVNPPFPLATDFILPPSTFSLYLVTYGIAIDPMSNFSGSFNLELTDPPAVPIATPVIGSSLGVSSLSDLTTITCFVQTTGLTPSLSVVASTSQLGPALVGVPDGETAAFISITKLK